MEIARLNKKESSNGIFPEKEWKATVRGDNHPIPRLFIEKIGTNVEAIFNIETGELLYPENYKEGNNQFIEYMTDCLQSWFYSPCCLIAKVTNKEMALAIWYTLQD